MMIGYSLFLSELKESGSVQNKTVLLPYGDTASICDWYDFLDLNPQYGFALGQCLVFHVEFCFRLVPGTAAVTGA